MSIWDFYFSLSFTKKKLSIYRYIFSLYHYIYTDTIRTNKKLINIYTQSSVSHTSVYKFLCLSYAVMFEMGLTRLYSVQSQERKNNGKSSVALENFDSFNLSSWKNNKVVLKAVTFNKKDNENTYISYEKKIKYKTS